MAEGAAVHRAIGHEAVQMAFSPPSLMRRSSFSFPRASKDSMMSGKQPLRWTNCEGVRELVEELLKSPKDG